jgi:hypothetical protein
MNWPGARFWIDAMNAANYLGVNGWRLPTALNQDGSRPCGPGYNCNDSEMGYMYYINLGNIAYPDVGWGLAHTAPFLNVQSGSYRGSGPQGDRVTKVASCTSAGWHGCGD